MGGGIPKPLLPWGASTMCGTVMEAALQAGLRVLVVTGYGQEAFLDTFRPETGNQPGTDARVTLSHNPGWEKGMLGSIAHGMAEARRLYTAGRDGRPFPGAVVALADMPGIPAEAFAMVAHAGFDHSVSGQAKPDSTVQDRIPDAPARVVFAEHDGTLGHPVFIPGHLVDALSGLDPDGRLRNFLLTQPWTSVHIDDDGIFADYDTPEAYRTSLPRQVK